MISGPRGGPARLSVPRKGSVLAALMVAIACLGLTFTAFTLVPAQFIPDESAPDLILTNAKVITMDDQDRLLEAIAVKGDRIIAVGAEVAIRKLAGRSTRVLDLGGRVVLPGFVDAHSHTSGVSPDYLELTEARSVAEIVEAVARKASAKPTGEWIVGAGPFMFWRGWDEQRLQERRLLTRWDLDPASPHHPVLLVKEAGHAVVLNSYALKLAGITRDTPDPRGQIMKDAATGEPTGVLLESAMYLGLNHLPPATHEDRMAATQHAMEQLLRFGTTTVANMSVGGEDIRAFQALYQRSGRPRVSTVLCPLVPAAGTPQQVVEFLQSWQVVSGLGNKNLKLGALKIFVDGGITGRAAWFKRPYKDRPGYHGIPQASRETLYETVRLADKLGWQLHLHACGDAAAELALEALEAAQEENQTTGRRHILTHLYVVSAEMRARMRRLGIVAVLQPNFVYSLGEHMRAALDDSQLEHIIPFRSLLADGVPVALSADGLPQNPMYGIYAAVDRKTELGNPLGPAEAVTVMDALRAYTRTSASALFEEKNRGSLEVGKLADAIVLDRDILTIPAAEIPKVQVLLTLKNGQIVFSRLSEVVDSSTPR